MAIHSEALGPAPRQLTWARTALFCGLGSVLTMVFAPALILTTVGTIVGAVMWKRSHTTNAGKASVLVGVICCVAVLAFTTIATILFSNAQTHGSVGVG